MRRSACCAALVLVTGCVWPTPRQEPAPYVAGPRIQKSELAEWPQVWNYNPYTDSYGGKYGEPQSAGK